MLAGHCTNITCIFYLRIIDYNYSDWLRAGGCGI